MRPFIIFKSQIPNVYKVKLKSNCMTDITKSTYLMVALLATVLLLFGCTQTNPQGELQSNYICPDGSEVSDLSLCEQQTSAPEINLEPIQTHFSPGEVTQKCDDAITSVNATINEIAARPEGQRGTALLDYEEAMANFNDDIGPLYFTSYVYPDANISAEGFECEEKISMFWTETSTRKDIYNVLKDFVPNNENEARLYKTTIEYFELNGLNLPDDKLALVQELKQNLSSLENKFGRNLNLDNTTIEFTADELGGAPQDFFDRLDQTTDGKYIVTMKYPDYSAVMENVYNSNTRKKMNFAFYNRGSPEENTRLLEEAILLRQELAHELGFATWADYKTNLRMAKNASNVEDFIMELKPALAERSRQDLVVLLEFKKTFDPNATTVDPWDLTYLETQIKKTQYSLDNAKVREYFPLESVTKGMFAIYSETFNVSFYEVKGAKVWSPEVKLYRVADIISNETIAYIYFDLFPREGKYGREAMFPIKMGREKNGTYLIPISVIIANKNPPTIDKPSLLTHSEVVNLFHEFGHSLHNSFSNAPYASLSGTNVAWDFVETPSQTLENWPWDPQVIDELSGHYLNSSEKMPQDMRDKLIMTRDLGQGITYSSRLAQSQMDLYFHTVKGPVDVTTVSNEIREEFSGITPITGNHYPATFGHLMSGYDAGYYSYIWSEVYALECFSEFEKNGLQDQATGMRFRNELLSQGDMKDGDVLLRNFLGREPNMDAFFKRMNITSE